MFNNNILFNNINNVTTECETCNDIDTWKYNLNNDLLTVIHINVRSIRAKWDLLCVKLEPVLNQLDVLILTEINVKEEEALAFQLENFNQISKCRVRKQGGGVMLFYRDTIQIENLSYDFDEAENLSIKLTHLGQKTEWTILAIYRPPSCKLDEFLEDINFWLQNAAKKDDNIIMIGDVNVCIRRKSNTNSKYLNTLYNNTLVPLIKKPTREEVLAGKATISCLDHINVRMKRQFSYTATVIMDKVADHYFIGLRVTKANKDYINYVKNPVFKTILDNKKIQQQIEAVNWASLNDITEPEQLYDEIINDSCIISIHKDVASAVANAQQDFIELQKYFYKNHIFLNEKKTEAMVLGFASKRLDMDAHRICCHSRDCLVSRIYEASCSCLKIEYSTNVKYLGMLIDEEFKMKPHVHNLNKKLRIVNYKFNKINADKLPLTTKKTLYFSLVDSLLRYGAPFYTYSPKYVLDSLNKTQKRIKKFLFKDKDDIQILTPDQLAKFILICLNFQNDKYRQLNDQPYPLRTQRFKRTRVYTVLYGERRLDYIVPTLLNDFCLDFLEETNRVRWKSKLKSVLFNNQFT
ncbi:hypothetical protein M8J77_010667 [Diaphorina citri]|nr:hypothetical protein M8J77_010667 [Diaphorina citri]